MYRSKDISRTIQRDLFINLLVTIAVQLVTAPIVYASTLDKLIRGESNPTSALTDTILKEGWELSLTVFFLIISIMALAIYATWNSKLNTPREVTKLSYEEESFSFFQNIFLLRFLKSRYRIAVASCLLFIGFILWLSVLDMTHWIPSVVITLAITNALREVNTDYGAIREALTQVLSQSLVTFGKSIEAAVRRHTNQSLPDLRIRSAIMLFDEDKDKLIVAYSYRMKGDDDWEIEIGNGRGVAGRAFKDGEIVMENNFFSENGGSESNLSGQQLAQIPTDIKWRMGFPLRSIKRDDAIIGVLIVDGNKKINNKILNEIILPAESLAKNIEISISLLLKN